MRRLARDFGALNPECGDPGGGSFCEGVLLVPCRDGCQCHANKKRESNTSPSQATWLDLFLYL